MPRITRTRPSHALPSAPRAARLSRLLVGVAALMVPSAALRAQDSSAVKAPAGGAFTDEQAERGNGVFKRVCVECHTQKDMSGADFRLNWNGRTVFDLFERIRTTMPEAAPGSLSREEYADVTSYFLKLNGMPTGSMPMPADSTLVSIKLDIPAPPPSFLVLRSLPRSHARPSAHPPVHTVPRASHSTLFRGF